MPNIPDSQVHVILGDNGGATTTWLKHTNNGYPSGGGIGYPGQYWFVDLGDHYTVDDVVIYNRTDCTPSG